MDRNIVTKNDAVVARQHLAAKHRFERQSQGLPPDEKTLGSGDLPNADTAAARLAKFIPGEALGLYLALSGIVTGTDIGNESKLYWLGGLLAICCFFNFLYLTRIWQIRRKSQVIVSSFALLVYALATGNQLVQSIPGYSPVYASIALTIITAFLTFFQPPEPVKTEAAAGT